MTPEHVKETYRRMIDEIGEPIVIRRYTGAGVNRPHFDVEVRARVAGYQPEELVGGIVQGDRRIIVLVEDLIDAQFALPIVASDKVLVRGGPELAITKPDDSTRRIHGVLIAYELTAKG
jgi:hypothetical protein